MEYVVTSLEAKQADEYTIETLGVPSLDLMEKAGTEIFHSLTKILTKESRILIITGSGGNGGDGYVLGRLLFENDYKVEIFKASEPKNDETIINFNKYKGEFVNQIEDKYDFVVDAIYGTGCNFNLKEDIIKIVNKINSLNSFIVSIDVPSGLDATTGKVKDVAVKSNLLLSIEFYKTGFFLNEGVNYFDKIELIKIGIKSPKIVDFSKVFSEKDYKTLINKRTKISNKSTYGRCAIIGGSFEFSGAPLLSLSSLSCLKLGAGYSTLCIPDKLYNIYALKDFEVTYKLFKSSETGNILFDKEKLDSILHYEAIAIGMGIGISEEVYKIISYLLKNYNGRLLIDADALNSISKYGVEILKEHKCDVIITPHILEFARLNNIEDKNLIINDPIKYAKEFSKKYNVYVVLKNNITITCFHDEIYFNINGNPSLAKGGSGDVLSGIILGSIVKSKELLKSISFGSYILGKSADLAIKNINENSVLARDIINNISNVLTYISNLK